ncbi:MAG TPA: copper-containing nitrite reductase [Steroidobacteraceae bacterium]|nr:copper-containing nitrite reductase [Steroidobacteraceae bacterium]
MKQFVLFAVAAFGFLSTAQAGFPDASAALGTTRASAEFDEIRGEERAVVTSAPFVPPPLNRRHATKVLLDVEVKEHTKVLADGVTYTYWTFGDDAPGQFIRVREGDLVQTKISNHPDNSVAHNIDFHSATGPGGGGEASFVAPGHSATFTWRAMRAGLYLYHCVAAPAGLHLANGMYGLILVEPKQGMPKVDKEFFIVQGEFYTNGAYGERGNQQFDMSKAVREQPEYVVFNGRVGALMGENALRMKAGESVRLYLGNAGPALMSSFHIVGEIFDDVYGEGGTKVNQHNVQTTVVPVGGSAMVDFVMDVPGAYQFVDHSMFRAFNKGAMGAIEVEGPVRPEIFSGRQSQEIFNPGTRLQRVAAVTTSAAPAPKPAQQVASSADSAIHAQGKEVYEKICTVCHQSDGRGMAGVFPPLAKSDYLMHDSERAIRVLLEGLQGPITVNGQTFNGVMPNFSLSDAEIAAVLSYVRTNFGNSGAPVAAVDVQRVRALLAKAGSEPKDRTASDRR